MTGEFAIQPLSDKLPRTEAIERCIGPVAVLYAIDFVDSTRDRFAEIMDEVRFEMETGLGNVGYLMSDERDMSPLERDLEVAMELPRDHWVPPDTSPVQDAIFKRYVHYNDELDQMLEEAQRGQSKIFQKIAAPGFIACRDGVDTATAKKRADSLEGTELAILLRDEDMLSLLNSLSISANGAFVQLLASRFSGQNNDHDLFELIRKQVNESVPSYDLQPVGIENLCVKKDGHIKLTPEAIKTLRVFMKLDNETGIHNNDDNDVPESNARLRGSRGCPVAAKTFRVNPDDLTEAQWSQMLNAPSPIAEYDTESRKLTVVRNAISEQSLLLADLIEAAGQIPKAPGVNPS